MSQDLDHPISAAAEATELRARAATRISSDYVLRALQLVRTYAAGDLIDGVIRAAIIQANVGHLISPDTPGGGGVEPPDELLRPVSVMSLSATLGVPYETMRRRVTKMSASGICKRVRGGFIVPSALIDKTMEVRRANFANLRRLRKALIAAGVDVD